MIQTLRSTIAEIDPQLALQEVRPLAEAISEVEAPRHFNTELITAFAGGALLLAVIGIYAVTAFSVSQRAQEIAIRMTLGAQRSDIATLVLLSAAKLVLLGCSLGVVGSLAVSHVISAFLFGVSATDPLVHSGAVLLMMLTALLASAFPAMRASSTDPVTALRSI
jgi:putative ABC transport system permease protein